MPKTNPRGPLDPIFDVKKKRGSIQIGNSYPSEPVSNPTVTINKASGQADPANGGAIVFDIVFSEAVIGFTAGDVTVSGTASSTFAPVLTGSGTTYQLIVKWFDGGTGTIIASIPAGVCTGVITGLTNLASTSTDNDVVRDYWAPPVAGFAHLWDIDNVSTLTLSGGPSVLDQVDNQVGGAPSMTSSGTGRPILTAVGDELAGDWDGSNDWMRATSVAIDGDHTIFIVANIESTNTRVLLEHSADWNTNNGMLINPNSSTEMGYGVRRSSANSARTATTTTTGLHVWTFRADGTHANQTIRKDGVALSTTSVGAGYNSDVGTGTVTDALNWGARNVGASLQINGQLVKVLIYNSTLSDGDCDTVDASLMDAVGI